MYRLQYLQKLERRGVIIPLITGRAIHAYQQALREGLSPEQCELALEKEFDVPDQDKAMLNRDQQAKFEIERYRAIAMMRAYLTAYPTDATQYKKWITESHIEIPIEGLDDVVYHGYIDCLVQDVAGDWWIFETKSAANATVNADYFERVKIDGQVAGYMELAKAKLGFYPKGIVYDVIIKTQHSQKKGESTAAFISRLTHLYVNEWKNNGLFERMELELSPTMVDAWREDMKMLANEIKSAIDRKEKVWPKNTGNCLGKFGSCKFMPICTTGKVSKLLYAKRK
jgi:hypothetical protein